MQGKYTIPRKCRLPNCERLADYHNGLCQPCYMWARRHNGVDRVHFDPDAARLRGEYAVNPPRPAYPGRTEEEVDFWLVHREVPLPPATEIHGGGQLAARGLREPCYLWNGLVGYDGCGAYFLGEFYGINRTPDIAWALAHGRELPPPTVEAIATCGNLLCDQPEHLHLQAVASSIVVANRTIAQAYMAELRDRGSMDRATVHGLDGIDQFFLPEPPKLAPLPRPPVAAPPEAAEAAAVAGSPIDDFLRELADRYDLRDS